MNRLREMRFLKRISQFRLRRQTGIHQSKISLIENGLIDAREDEKKKLAQALRCRIEEVFPAKKKSEEKTGADQKCAAQF